MSVILDFNENEKQNLVKLCMHNKKIGMGAEASCYLLNGNVYKIYNQCSKNHNFNNMICEDDLELNSFLFPKEIYTCNNQIFAYTSKYIEKNYLDIDNLLEGNALDINKFKKALKTFIKDLYILSNNNIYAYELPLNFLFDGKNIYGIDTLSYVKVDYNPYSQNISLLKDGIIYIFELYEKALIDSDAEEFDYYDKLTSKSSSISERLINYIDKISKETEKSYKDKEIQKIKKH